MSGVSLSWKEALKHRRLSASPTFFDYVIHNCLSVTNWAGGSAINTEFVYNTTYTVNSCYNQVGYDETPVITKCLLIPDML